MWRIIEILKYFQYSCSVNIAFLMEKFNVTFRTLQRNITFINTIDFLQNYDINHIF
ncbi:hypothetical protein [Spiroplasma endosymbiont of Colias croceus]|uniref:hypothetical protein n=1 Tax=Spiroplasma endosymbiont of Colias croceus TaxID=3066310 RepID=UPI0030D55266